MNTMIKKLLVLATISLPLMPAQQAIQAQCGCQTDNALYANLPFDMPRVERPSFPDYAVSILQYGAKGDGITLNTKAINEAIQAVHTHGGG